MNYIIKLVIEYQACKSDLIFEDLVNELADSINGYKNKIPKYYRDDFKQELWECLFKVVNRFSIKRIKTISISLFNKENFKLLERFEFKNVNEVLRNKYVSGFIEKYGRELLVSAFKNDDKLILFLSEFELFCNENQFIKYLNITFDRKVKLFYRDLKKNEDIKCISLNLNIANEIELLDLIPEEKADEEIELFYDDTLLSNNDKMFLELFKEDDKIITGKDVANKLNITQQAVSSRLKRLKKRYIKEFNKKYKKVEM